MNTELVFPLLVAYQFKHFVADYPLQGEYMLKKFAKDPATWIPALAAHAGVHALFTLVIGFIVLGYHPAALALATLDFAVHFTMDRIKASPNMLGRYKSLDASAFMNIKAILLMEHKDIYDPTVVQAKRRLWHNKFFWWSLGFDQMVHHLTHYLIIACLVSL